MTTRRLIVAALIFAGGMVAYMDRAVFGVMAPMIQADLGLNSAQMGAAHSAFAVGYVAVAFFGGWLADKFGPKLVLSFAMLVWSGFCALTGAVGGFASLLGVRLAFGGAEAPWISCSNKVLYNWFSAAGYTSAFGLASAGQPMGGVIAGPIVGVLVVWLGWRGGFLAVGALGLVWLAAWLWLGRNGPETGSPLTGASTAAPLEIPADSGPPPALATTLLQPIIVANSLCMFGYGYLLTFFLSWFPSYLSQSRGLDLADMSLASAIPWAGGVAGLVTGGFFSQILVRRLGRPLLARKIIVGTGLAITALCLLLVTHFRTSEGAVACMAIAVFFIYFTGPNYWAISMAAAPPAHVGSVGGLMVGVAQLGSIVAPLVTGVTIQLTHGYGAAFMIAGGMGVAGALILAVFARPRGPSNSAV